MIVWLRPVSRSSARPHWCLCGSLTERHKFLLCAPAVASGQSWLRPLPLSELTQHILPHCAKYTQPSPCFRHTNAQPQDQTHAPLQHGGLTLTSYLFSLARPKMICMICCITFQDEQLLQSGGLKSFTQRCKPPVAAFWWSIWHSLMTGILPGRTGDTKLHWAESKLPAGARVSILISCCNQFVCGQRILSSCWVICTVVGLSVVCN